MSLPHESRDAPTAIAVSVQRTGQKWRGNLELSILKDNASITR